MGANNAWQGALGGIANNAAGYFASNPFGGGGNSGYGGPSYMAGDTQGTPSGNLPTNLNSSLITNPFINVGNS
jgi:hypothetical protein